MQGDAPVISTRNLTKRYGAVTALDGIDVNVPAGVTYGFLGPNGAGKTTTIRILMGFIRPTSGEACMAGHDCWTEGVRARENIGYLVPAEALYREMTGQALLDYVARLSGMPPRLRRRLLDALELSQDALQRRIGGYSKGMKQKLALTASMQTEPTLLILDEPTDGLDPLIQRSFEQVLDEVHRQGTTIFMSSHDLAEVERTCEIVAIIREGRIVAEETIAELRARHQRTVEVTFASQPPFDIAQVPGMSVVHRDDRRLILSLYGPVAPLLDVLSHRPDVIDLLITRPSLEDMFMGYYDTTQPPRSREAEHVGHVMTPQPELAPSRR